MKSRYFTETELACRHCGVCKVTPELVAALEDLRELAGVPVVVHDAYRCPEHNAAVGGVPDSEHPRGEAADIEFPGKSLKEMYLLALKIPAFANGGIGLYDGKPFLHVDVRRGAARWARIAGKYTDINQLLHPLPAKETLA